MSAAAETSRDQPGNDRRQLDRTPYSSAAAETALAGQVVEQSLLDREARHSDSWRRGAFALAVIVALQALGLVVLLMKAHYEGLIYHEDRAGNLALMGRTTSEVTPSDPAVKKALADWIGCARGVPGNDPELVNLCAAQVLTMVAKDSPADASYRRYILSHNPLALNRDGLIRTVTAVEVTKLTALTYRVAWREAERHGADAPHITDHVGSVTLAQAPRVPNDPVLGAQNPAGLFIWTLDMPWAASS